MPLDGRVLEDHLVLRDHLEKRVHPEHQALHHTRDHRDPRVFEASLDIEDQQVDITCICIAIACKQKVYLLL